MNDSVTLRKADPRSQDPVISWSSSLSSSNSFVTPGDSHFEVCLCGLYHHGEDNGGPGGLDDPQQGETGELDDGEEVHLPQGHVAEVDEVGLMLSGHAEQLEAVEELRERERRRESIIFM